MTQNKFNPFLVAAIVALVLIAGYILLSPNKQAESQSQNQNNNTDGPTPLVNGKQLLQMTVQSVRYNPSYFKVKTGVPVRWEISSSGQPGCASGAVIANGLVDGPIYLNP